MAQSSNLGYWEWGDTSMFDADQPMDTARTHRTVNNLNHLFDEQTQHRVNWMASGLGNNDAIYITTGSGTVHWEATVPWTMMRNRMPANCDFYITGATSNAGTPTTFTLKMVPWWGTFDEPPGNVFFEDTTGTTTSTTGATAADGNHVFSTTANAKMVGLLKTSIREFKIDNEDGETLVSRVPLVKFIVQATNASVLPYILGVQIREFV